MFQHKDIPFTTASNYEKGLAEAFPSLVVILWPGPTHTDTNCVVGAQLKMGLEFILKKKDVTSQILL